MSGVKLGGRESDLTIPECGLAIMLDVSRLDSKFERLLYLFTKTTAPYGSRTLCESGLHTV